MAFRVKRSNRRYVATLTRTAYEDSLSAPPPAFVRSDSAKIQLPATQWSFAFEGHERARFALSVGVGGIFKPDSRDFALVKSLNGEGKVVHTVRQSQGAAFDSKPFATLGIYLGDRVDMVDTRRAPRWALVVGTEVKTSPDAFLVGLARDFAGGLQISAGVTHYRSKELAPAWSLGQIVPVDDEGKPLVDAVPTVSRGRIGVFVGVAFRPAIFGAFRDLLK
jgi:hypothetical protein